MTRYLVVGNDEDGWPAYWTGHRGVEWSTDRTDAAWLTEASATSVMKYGAKFYSEIGIEKVKT